MTRSAKRTHSSRFPWAGWLNIILAVFGLWLMVEITSSSAPKHTDEIRLPVSLKPSGTEPEVAFNRVTTYADEEEGLKIEPVANIRKKKKTVIPSSKRKHTNAKKYPQQGVRSFEKAVTPPLKKPSPTPPDQKPPHRRPQRNPTSSGSPYPIKSQNCDRQLKHLLKQAKT